MRTVLIYCEQNCKPGSVFDSHLSRRAVANALQPPRERPGQPFGDEPRRSHTGVAPDRVYSIGLFPADGCALTAPFHPYWNGKPNQRYISVALFLKSPSAGVTRYPCPVEPGLSSWTAFRPAHAAVCLTRGFYFTKKRGRCQPEIGGPFQVFFLKMMPSPAAKRTAPPVPPACGTSAPHPPRPAGGSRNARQRRSRSPPLQEYLRFPGECR